VVVSVSPEEQSQLVPGYRLDRYELLCPIGTGGMASVWVARLLGKHGFEKLVAIKTILPRYARDPQFQRMFLDEARIASRIQHVNVGQILDLGDHQGVLFLAMEWIEGDALSKLARIVQDKRLTFPPGVALRIAADVCQGLHAAHELRDRGGAPLDIVHRDVSPHNILINDQGSAKVIDFGIAKARDRVGGETETGSLRGKVRYMSPEQALSPRTADRRADIWAVGAVLYYLLVGRSPYAGESDVATLTQLTSGRPPLPLPARIPAGVREVTTRALAWKREDRYATAAEFGKALEEAIVELGTPATTAEVAAFCTSHLAAQAEARRTAVATALTAAEERSRVARVSSPTKSAITIADSGRQADRAGARATAAAAAPLLSNPPGHTSLTLGAAAAMTSSPSTTLPATRWRLAAAFLAIALVAVGGISIARRPDTTRASASSGAVIAATAIPVALAAPPAPAATMTASRPSVEATSSAVPVANLPVANPPPASVPIANPTPRRPPAARTGGTAPVPKRKSEYGF
jgi:hypothetical protein